MKRGKSRLLSGLLSVSMAFSVISIPIKAFAATDTSGHWAEASINSWINSGYINGYPDGTFRPNNAISRAEFVTIANKAFGFTRSQGISFDDVKPGYWAYGEIQKGVAAGYIQGDSNGTFRPGSAVTRQEAAVMLSNLKGYDSDEAGAYNYTDRADMANWAVGAIGAVSRNGVMSGYPNGTFRPQQSLTRAEAVAALQKVAASSNSFTSANTTNYTSPNYVTTNTTNSGFISSSNTNTRTTSNDNDYGFNGIVLEDTRMENRNLTKDLLIPRSLGSKNITLKNVRLKGTLYVEGGGTITLENCNITNVVMDRANAVLKNNGSSDIGEVRFEEKGRLDGKGYGTVLIDDNSISEVILDADIDTLILDAEVDVRLYANSNIDTFEITKNADNARIRIGEDAQVSDMQIYDKVRISGKGKIDVMTVYVSNVRSEIEPKRLIQQDNARKPNFSYKDDDDDDDYDNLTLDSDDENFDGEGDKFNRVRISAEDVTAKDFTVYDDLIITSSAGDSTIELEDVTVRGNVYVEGGGDSSVIFDDCSISGNIYSRKSTSGRYDEAVAIKLRNTPVRGDIYVTGDTILESDEKLRKVILNRALSKTFRMNANAENLTINYNNTVQIRGNNTIDTAEVAAGLNNVSITMDGGKIGTFTVRSPIRMDGTGTIDKLVTGEANDISSNITIGTTEEIDGSGTTPSGSHTITASVQGGNGTISPSGQQSVTNGATKEFVITANANYHVGAIIVDGNEVNLNNNSYQGYTYTFNNVTANHDIIVSFAEGAGNGNGSSSNGTPGGNNPSEGDYTIAVTVNGNGGSADNMMIPVKDGEDASVKFTADKDYHISKIVIDAGTESEQNLKRISDSTVTFSEVTYTFKNVTKNHTISVEFAQGQGTNEIGILSTDEDTAMLKPSGYKYDITTELYNTSTNRPLAQNEDGRYYCIAGDRITLAMLKFDTDDPNKEYLKTRWAVVNSTTGMEMELFQRDGESVATLQTTEGSGYAAVLKVQVYDTNKETTVPIASSDVAELHVDVPLEELRLDSSSCQGNQFSLSPQNLICIPSNASIASDKQSITWEVIETNIEPVSLPLIAAGDAVAKIVDISDGNNGTFPSLRVEQPYKETELSEATDLVTQPMGSVTLRATIPNGAGNLVPKTQYFTVNFVGNTIIPVESIKLNATDKEVPKEIYGIGQLDLSGITSTLVPKDSTYKTVEWQIETETDYLTGETTTITQDNPAKLGTIKTKKVNGEDREVIFESTGYPGRVVLRPYIKHGKGADGDFISENPDERITVKIATIEPVVTANNIASPNGTDEGDKITLSAKVTNADKTPYTEIKGWRKTTVANNPQEDDWQDIDDITLSKSADGTYTAEYTVKKEDLNENSAYDSNIVYFQAYTEYDMTDSAIEKIQERGKTVYSNIVSVDCHAQAIELPDKTTYGGQTITVDRNNTTTIKGYDTVTLSPTLDNGTSIAWTINPEEDSIATLNDNVLTVKGQPNKSFQLIATVTGKGPITFTINTAFEKVDTGKSRITVRDNKNTNISGPIKTGTTIYFYQLEVNPKYATYNDESIDINNKLSWRVRNGDNIEDVDANEDGIGEYTVPADATGKLLVTALWQNAGDDGSAAESNPIEVQIVDNFVAVSEIDFSDTGLEPTPVQGEDKYTYTIQKVEKDIDFNLGSARILPANATANLTQNRVQWTSTPGSSIDAEIATLNNNVLKVPGYTKGGTITLTARVANGLGENQDYVATLTLTIPKGTGQKPETPGTDGNTGGTSGTSEEANTFDLPRPSEDNADTSNPINDVVSNENNTENPGTENNKDTAENESNKNDVPEEDNKVQDNTNEIVIPFTAVSDINFDDINDLQKLPSQEYTITSDRTKQITLRLADSTSTVNGITKHTGIKVVPSDATNQTVTWSAKNTTLTAIPNVVEVNGMGTLNLNSNIFILNANVSGTVTLVATVKNGKTEQENFVKELVIHVDKPVNNTTDDTTTTKQNSTSDNTTSSNTTNNSTSSNTTANMPSNTTQAAKKQVISVGDTSVGTSSVTSASAATTRSNTNVTSAARSTSNSDVKIEVSGQCKKGISIPLKAVSKSSQKEYTDVDWEITDDGGTNARITSGNRLRATSTGTVTITATIYTSSGTMTCSTNIAISD